jgi:hypothetical protein
MQKWNFIHKNKKKINFIFYISFIFIFFFATYISIPKLLNFSLESVKKNLKNNNDINIDDISKIDYQIFPTPRLSIPNSNFTIGKNIIEVNNSEIKIILNISQILNFKKISYKKLLIYNGYSKIDLSNINQFLKNINKNKKKIVLKKNNIIFLKKEKTFLKISNALIKIEKYGKDEKLNINGDFLNNKIFITLNNTSKNENNLSINIPDLDIVTRIFFKGNNSSNINGSLNLEVFNNFLKLNFTKEDNIKLTDGFIRSKIINSLFKGEVTFKPNFYVKLELNPSSLNMKKLFPLIKKTYFSDNSYNLSLIKKFNGILNFKSKFEGKIINENGEMIFENFKVGKNKSLLLNAKIIEFGENAKIYFDLSKIVEFRRDPPKKIEIAGLLIPSNSEVIFENILIDGSKLPTKQVKKYENLFNKKIIQNSLVNIFSENKINKYLKNLF